MSFYAHLLSFLFHVITLVVLIGLIASNVYLYFEVQEANDVAEAAIAMSVNKDLFRGPNRGGGNPLW